MTEGDALDWLSVLVVAAAALAAAILATRLPARRGRFGFLAALLGFLALDDAIGLHERISAAAAANLGLSSRGDVLFLLPYLPLLLAGFLLLWKAARDAGGLARRTLYGGLALLAAALSARVLGTVVLAAGLDPPLRALGAAAIHDAELAAWLLVAAGLAALLTDSNRSAMVPGR